MSKHDKAPLWVCHNVGVNTQREFKALKRKQFAAARKALADFRLGCAFCPDYKRVSAFLAEMDAIQKDVLSVKRWGR